MKIDFLVVENVDPKVYLFESIFQNALEAELQCMAQLFTFLLVNDEEMPSANEIHEIAIRINLKHRKWRRETITEFLEILDGKKSAET